MPRLTWAATQAGRVMDHSTFLLGRPGPSGQLWNQILQLLGSPPTSAVGEQLGEPLSVLGIRGLSV